MKYELDLTPAECQKALNHVISDENDCLGDCPDLIDGDCDKVNSECRYCMMINCYTINGYTPKVIPPVTEIIIERGEKKND